MLLSLLASLLGAQDHSGSLRDREARSPLVEREADKKIANEPADASSPGRLIGWTLGVLGLLAAFLYGLRRWAARHPMVGGSPFIEILGRRRLATGHEIVLVEIADRILVVAAGSGGVNVLSEIADRSRIQALKGQGGEGSAGRGERVPATQG